MCVEGPFTYITLKRWWIPVPVLLTWYFRGGGKWKVSLNNKLFISLCCYVFACHSEILCTTNSHCLIEVTKRWKRKLAPSASTWQIVAHLTYFVWLLILITDFEDAKWDRSRLRWYCWNENFIIGSLVYWPTNCTGRWSIAAIELTRH